MFASRSVISTPPRFGRDYTARATLGVFAETHRLRTSDAERDQGVSRKPSLPAIRESRRASSPWAVSRTRFASGTSSSLNVAVASAGWRSLEACAMVTRRIVKRDLRGLLGQRSHHPDAVLRMAHLHTDVERHDVHVTLELCEIAIEVKNVMSTVALRSSKSLLCLAACSAQLECRMQYQVPLRAPLF